MCADCLNSISIMKNYQIIRTHGWSRTRVRSGYVCVFSPVAQTRVRAYWQGGSCTEKTAPLYFHNLTNLHLERPVCLRHTRLSTGNSMALPSFSAQTHGGTWKGASSPVYAAGRRRRAHSYVHAWTHAVAG